MKRNNSSMKRNHSSMKWDRPFLTTLVFGVFTILYTIYIAQHPHAGAQKGAAGIQKGAAWTYLIGFLFFDVYIYFILQGLGHRSKNWDMVLLLPLAIWVLTISLGFLVVLLFRLGGLNDRDKHNIDMVIISLVLVALSIYAQKWIRPHKKSRSL